MAKAQPKSRGKASVKTSAGAKSRTPAKTTGAKSIGANPAAPAKTAAGTKSAVPAPAGRPWIKIVILAVFATALIAFFALGGQQYLTLETIKANRDALVALTRQHYALAIVVAFAVYALAVALSIPGAVVLTLLCGFLFGRWVGTLVVITAATLGATIVFLAARYLFADWARSRTGEVGRKINDGFSANAFSYMLFLRLVPAFPFFLVNLAPALTSIRLPTYVVATFIGIIPGSFVYANLGETLGTIDSLSGLVSKETLLAFALLGVLALAPIVIRKLKGRRAA